MNRIVIEDVIVINNRIKCPYSIYGEWSRYFRETRSFFAEYTKQIDRVPKSIAVIPFLCNVLPLVWIFDAEVVIDDIDQDFFECIEAIKQGYVNMYPNVSFKGRITSKKITYNRQENLDNAAVFSVVG